MKIVAIAAVNALAPRPETTLLNKAPLTASPIGPEVSVTLSPEAIASAGSETLDDAASSGDEARPGHAETSGPDKVAQAVGAQPAKGDAGPWVSFMEKVSGLLFEKLGVPEGKGLILSGAAMSLITQVAAGNGLALPQDAHSSSMLAGIAKEGAEATGLVRVVGSKAGDADFLKEMVIAFVRDTAVDGKTLRLRNQSEQDGHPILAGMLDQVVRDKAAAGHLVTPADRIRTFTVVGGSTGSGQVAGTVMSLGLDDLAREKGAAMLTTILSLLSGGKAGRELS